MVFGLLQQHIQREICISSRGSKRFVNKSYHFYYIAISFLFLSFFSPDDDFVKNSLYFRSDVSELLNTTDNTDLDYDCTVAYSLEAGRQINAMLARISAHIQDLGCGEVVEEITTSGSFISIGKQVIK